LKKKLSLLAVALMMIPVMVVLTACGGLGTPTDLARAANGNWTWNHVTDATQYEFRIVGGGHTVYLRARVGGTGAVANAAIANNVVTVTNTNFTSAIAAHLTAMVAATTGDHASFTAEHRTAFENATSWAVTIRAIDADDDTSGWSNTVTFNPNPTPDA